MTAVAPILRGACSLKDEKIEGAWRRLILDFRSERAILDFVNGAELARYSQAGVVTPDHTIRTKNWPLVVTAPEDGKIDDFKRAARAAAQAFIERYKAYFARNNARVGGIKKMLDPLPRVALVPGLGLFGLGRSQEGRRASPPTSRNAPSRPSPTPRRSAASNRSPKPTCSTWNTGRSSRPSSAQRRKGRSPARSRSSPARAAPSARRPRKPSQRAGAEVALLDLDEAAARNEAKAIGGTALAVNCDVTDAASVRRRLRQGGRDLRRRRHRGVERGRRLAGPHRRGRRGDAAQELRAEFLRPPARRAGGGEDHAGAGHRRLPPVQRVEAGGESGTEFRPLWTAEGGDAVPGAAIRARLRRRRHPRQRGQCRPHPLGPAHRRVHRRALQGARR